MSKNDREPRQPRVSDVAFVVGLEEMQVGSAEPDAPQPDHDVVGSGIGLRHVREIRARVAPHAAADQGLSGGGLFR
jgi:hypothetical protein